MGIDLYGYDPLVKAERKERKAINQRLEPAKQEPVLKQSGSPP